MKQINNKLAKVSTIVFSALIGVACGGGGGGGGDGDGGTTPVTPTNVAPVAEAGTNLLVSRNFTVNLDGSASSDADADALTYTWTQTAGSSVGSLSGATPSFSAPGEVETIIFSLVVNDGTEDSPADTVIINVLEDANVAYFVDGDNGSDDTGNGSTLTPFASIAKALCEVTADQQDIYVLTRAAGAAYDESADPCPGPDPMDPRSAALILTAPTGTSFYGGYGVDGVRNAATSPTVVNALHHGFRFGAVDLNAWFSGFNVLSGKSPSPADSVYALSAIGGSASITITDNILRAGNVDFGAAAIPGSSYGVLVALIEGATIERNTISAGFGGDGLDTGLTFPTAATVGQNGFAAGGRSAGAGGDGRGGEDYDGGAGGGGGGLAAFCLGGFGSGGGKGQGLRGGGGGARGSSCGGGGGGGGPGANGNPGAIGAGGPGTAVMDVFEDGGFFASFRPGKGNNGRPGEAGHGGGGGGGGRGNALFNGGGGGGGGGGGSGGAGGIGGPSGGVSVGLFIAAVTSVVIDNNDISSGLGGFGATGGQGQIGGAGGARGDGAEASAGNGGNGGIGGTGGSGGRGGAGSGGPSYGIAVGSAIMPSISNNQIASGDGGLGGFGGNGGNGGDGGHSFAVFDIDINDGFIPALINNDLTAGLPGDGGSTTDTNTGDEGMPGQSGTINW